MPGSKPGFVKQKVISDGEKINGTNLGFEYFTKPLTIRKWCVKFSKPLEKFASFISVKLL